MTDLGVIVQQLKDLTEGFNTLVAGIKKTTAFPFMTDFDSSSAIRVEIDGGSQYILLQQIIDAAVLDANNPGENEIVSGNIAHIGGFQYKTVNLVYRLNNILYYSNGLIVEMAGPDAEDRIDVIRGDDTGLVSILPGIADTPPIKPIVDTTSELELTFGYIAVGSSQPSDLDTRTVYLENLQEVGGEFDSSENTSGARIDLANGTDTIEGSIDIKTIDDLDDDDEFVLTHSTPVQVGTFDFIKLTIKSLRNWGKDKINIQLYSGVTLINKKIVITKNNLNTSDFVTNQELYFFKDQFGSFDGTVFDTIKFVNKSSGEILYQMDEIYIQSGGNVPPVAPVVASDIATDTSNFDNNLSALDDTVQKALDTIDDILLGDTPTVVVNSNKFFLRKHPDNNNPSNKNILETNDIIFDGYWNTTTWWPEAQYLGGDVDTIGNWTPFNPVEELTII